MTTTTEKATHTPGPWIVVSDGPVAQLFDATVIVSEHIDDAIICSIGGDVPGAEANARLIAAAPEMLAKLEKVIKWLRSNADRDEQQANQPNQFLTLRDACLADAKNYRATADDLEHVTRKARGAE